MDSQSSLVQVAAPETLEAPAAVSSEKTSTAHTTSKAPASEDYTLATTLATVEQLKEIAPDLYEAMLQGIAIQICGKMREHQENMHKIIKEATAEARG
jgi:hypothetical protein